MSRECTVHPSLSFLIRQMQKLARPENTNQAKSGEIWRETGGTYCRTSNLASDAPCFLELSLVFDFSLLAIFTMLFEFTFVKIVFSISGQFSSSFSSTLLLMTVLKPETGRVKSVRSARRTNSENLICSLILC